MNIINKLKEIENQIKELKIVYEKFIQSRKFSSDKNILFIFSPREFNQLHKANEIGTKFEYIKLLNKQEGTK